MPGNAEQTTEQTQVILGHVVEGLLVRGRIDIVRFHKTDVVEIREDFRIAVAILDRRRRKFLCADGGEMSNAAAAYDGAATASAVQDLVLIAD
jgi:hypothetical protein